MEEGDGLLAGLDVASAEFFVGADLGFVGREGASVGVEGVFALAEALVALGKAVPSGGGAGSSAKSLVVEIGGAAEVSAEVGVAGALDECGGFVAAIGVAPSVASVRGGDLNGSGLFWFVGGLGAGVHHWIRVSVRFGVHG